MAEPDVDALVFDVFGTVVDWHSAVVRDGELLSRRLGVPVPWHRFANEWRAGYAPALARVNSGERPWATVDVLHREILEELLPRYGLDALTEAERSWLNRVWHRLPPWPDAVPGLDRLRKQYVCATLSNGSTALLVALSRGAGLHWDCILSGELIRRYKPAQEVYLMAASLLEVAPDRLLMVAAHPGDLAGAAAAGLRIAYVPRPWEFGPGAEAPAVTAVLPNADLTAAGFGELADRLGA
jgi:2-haloacid dehalogenase